jgi:FtsP/CotA-like multicopper oxidase with cupredoxin domain
MASSLDRRAFLAALGYFCAAPARGLQTVSSDAKPDFTIRIAPVSIEIAPKRTIKTTGYNGSVPGPVLRMDEGRPVTIDVHNDTSTPELVHWHGLFAPSEVDGAAEEGTPYVPARGFRRYQFTPRPSGTRWYHSHVYAGRDLQRSTYSGQFGFLQVVPRVDAGRYDREVLLALHGWKPFLTGQGDEDSLEVDYGAFTVNSHSLGSGEPVRVKEGERVLFRILNASASSTHRIGLAGHTFTVVALDGNAAPSPRPVKILELGPAERVDAIVEMNRPGVWILGEVDDRMRKLGLGTVVEYGSHGGAPQWLSPPVEKWDYTIFGREASAAEADEQIPLVFRQKWAGNRWVSHWTINGKEFPKTDPIMVRTGRRYRLIFDNQSTDMHPVHLHRHSFELVNVAGKAVSGVIKDVVNVMPRSKVEALLTAANPGPTLFHCHMQLHMDFGFMALLQYADSPAPAATTVHSH